MDLRTKVTFNNPQQLLSPPLLFDAAFSTVTAVPTMLTDSENE